MNANVRRSNIMCCVVGCNNSYNNTNGTVKFYGFPGRWYENEKRKIWVQRVRRSSYVNIDSLQWEPKVYHKVCSAHFVGNEKSNNPLNPAYNPTIFPPEYRSSTTESSFKSKNDRFIRSMRRVAAKHSASTITSHEVQVDELTPINNTSEDFCCQVNLKNENENFVFESMFSRDCREVSTQANIPHTVSLKSITEKCVGNNDNIECEGFHGYESLKDDREINSLCGVTFDRFAFLLSVLEPAHKNSKLSIENQLLMFLMKIKLGLSNSALGVLFHIHHTSCSRMFVKILIELTQKLADIVHWPIRSVIDKTMPDSFKMHYPKCRVIIDCTEVKIQQPNKVDHRIHTYSSYKGTFTAKFLVGVAPNGFITFISKCYGGRSSDSFITNDSGILNLLEPGDTVLADKGFPYIKCQDDVIVVMPPFVHEGMLTCEEVEATYNIASVRIHVERSIQRIKLYNILQKVSSNLFPYFDEIILMCCILANLQPPIIKDDCEKDDC